MPAQYSRVYLETYGQTFWGNPVPLPHNDWPTKRSAVDMSNEPTRRKLFHVDIKQEMVAPVLCYFVLSMIVTEVYEIRFLVAGIWCLLMFPLWWLGWWLGKMLWERRRG